MPDRLGPLWERRVPHLLVAYLGIGWAALSFVDWMVEGGMVSEAWVDVGLVLLIGLIPSALFLAWRAGSGSTWRPRRPEVVFASCNLIAALALATVVTGRSGVETVELELGELDSGRLTFLESDFRAVEYSPHGSDIVFITRDSLALSLVRFDLQSASPPDTLAQFIEVNRGTLRWTAHEGITLWARDTSSESWARHVFNEDARRRWQCFACSASPDLSEIAVGAVTPPDDIRVLEFDGETPGPLNRQLTLRPSTVFQRDLEWSMRGQLAVVIRYGWEGPDGAPRRERLDLVNMESGEQWDGLVSRPEGSIRFVRWAENGTGFDALVDGAWLRARVLGPDEGPVTVVDTLGYPPGGINGVMALSPDGKHVVYQQNVEYQSRVLAVDLSVADTLGYRNVRSAPVGFWQKGALTVSPEGDRIAFFDTGVASGASIWDLSADRVDVVNVGPLPANRIRNLFWSTDGRMIAAHVASTPDELVLVDLDRSTDPRTVPVELGGGGATWCSDGSLLVQVPGNRDYVVYDPSTGTGHLLFDGREQGWMFQPVCSPSGAEVAFQYNHREGAGLWIVNRSSGASRLLLPNDQQGQVTPLVWLDSGDIYYYLRSGGSDSVIHPAGSPPAGVYRIAAVGGDPELVVRLPYAVQRVEISRNGQTLATLEFESTRDLFLQEAFVGGAP